VKPKEIVRRKQSIPQPLGDYVRVSIRSMGGCWRSVGVVHGRGGYHIKVAAAEYRTVARIEWAVLAAAAAAAVVVVVVITGRRMWP